MSHHSVQSAPLTHPGKAAWLLWKPNTSKQLSSTECTHSSAFTHWWTLTGTHEGYWTLGLSEIRSSLSADFPHEYNHKPYEMNEYDSQRLSLTFKLVSHHHWRQIFGTDVYLSLNHTLDGSEHTSRLNQGTE